jgi:hypothetical protein
MLTVTCFSATREFQKFASASANTRAHGFPGYKSSADYVYGIAQAAGLDVYRQGVAFPVGLIRSVLCLNPVTINDSFMILVSSKSTVAVEGTTFDQPDVIAGFVTNVTLPEGLTTQLVAIPGYGCDEAEFANSVNKAVLLKGGQCENNIKTFNALRGSVAAVIIYDEARRFHAQYLVIIPLLTPS